jgi:hypothetical protein
LSCEESRRTVAFVGVSRSSLVIGVVEFAAIATLPCVVIWLVLHIDGAGEWLVALARRCRLLPPPPMCPADLPVQRLAADLRRLAAAVDEVPRGTTYARRKGLLAAYDDVLVSACRALEVPQSLSTLPYGMDRELERMRVEASLESAGLRFRPAAR